MKKIKRAYRIVTVFVLAQLSMNQVFGQAPDGFSYQAVLTNKDGEAISGSIGLRISVLKGENKDELLYSERHNATTDINGLTSVIVGQGNEIYTGKLSEIDWSQGPFYIRTEISPTGGFNYVIQTMSELLSVPYALHARRADIVSTSFEETDPVFLNSVASTIKASDISEWNRLSQKELHSVGEEFAGGIIFHIEPGGEHGLIVSKIPVGDQVVWGTSQISTEATSLHNGKSNTSAIVNGYGESDYAAIRCSDLTSGGFDDWYLPSIDEMTLLMNSAYQIDNSGLAEGLLWSQDYWTSTEIDDATVYSLGIEGVAISSKSEVKGVMAIRAF